MTAWSTTVARISVIVPVFNGAKFVGEALESIRAQTYPVAEVIVVDDGSADESADVVARFPFVKLLRKEHSGLAETLNRGIEEATGDYLAFLDADDRWLPEKTERQLAAFQSDPLLDMILGHARRVRSVRAAEKSTEITLDIVRGFAKSCLLVRRASFLRVGLFASNQEHDFLDWSCRAHEAGLRVRMLGEVVAERRIHGENVGLREPARQRQRYLRALKASLDRRREQAAIPARADAARQ